MKKAFCYFVLAIMPASAWAQSRTSLSDQANVENPSRWRLGLGVVASNDGYVGQGTKLTPIPLVNFEGKRFYFRGITGGAHLFEADQANGFALDAIVTVGFGGINAGDFSRADLARRGIDRSKLEDRGSSFGAGFLGTWTGRIGQIELEATSDISGNSKGQKYSLKYGYALHAYDFTITPSIGATYLSSKVSDYYYGIHNVEVRRGVPDYRVGSGATIPEVGVSVFKPIGKKWAMFFMASYGVLPSKIKNSPLIDGSNKSTVVIGLERSF